MIAYKNYGKLLLDDTITPLELLQYFSERIGSNHSIYDFMKQPPKDESLGIDILDIQEKAKSQIDDFLWEKSMKLADKWDWSGLPWEIEKQDTSTNGYGIISQEIIEELTRWIGFPWEKEQGIKDMLNEGILFLSSYDEAYYKEHPKEKHNAILSVNFSKVDNPQFLGKYDYSVSKFCSLPYIYTKNGKKMKKANFEYHTQKLTNS